MSSATAPRLTLGIAASVLLHAALVAAFLVVRPGVPAPEAPTIAIQLIAAPSGERAEGVVQEAPATPTAPTPPAPRPAVKPAPIPVVKRDVVRMKAPAEKGKPAPKLATATAAKTAEPTKNAGPPPVAGGGPVGAKGADVASVSTEGVQFDWPYYTTNIVSKILQRFGEMSGTLSASVRFVIRRDGSVDPESIQLVSKSGNYAFDQRAFGAVESAANAKAFGPLPSGFHDDILPVTMRFSPKVVR